MREELLIVDGYNMIGAWPELSHLQRHDEIQAARDLLLFELSNYSKSKANRVIVVFDAQFVPGVTQTYEEYNLEVVFTSEGETADSYIERTVSQYMNPLTRVIVATSDAAEQWMIFQQGALRQSAKELLLEVNYEKTQIRQDISTYYNSMLRRRSPWHVDQLKQLDRMRQQIEEDD